MTNFILDEGTIAYEDDYLLIIDKPAGMLVQHRNRNQQSVFRLARLLWRTSENSKPTKCRGCILRIFAKHHQTT